MSLAPAQRRRSTTSRSSQPGTVRVLVTATLLLGRVGRSVLALQSPRVDRWLDGSQKSTAMGCRRLCTRQLRAFGPLAVQSRLLSSSSSSSCWSHCRSRWSCVFFSTPYTACHSYSTMSQRRGYGKSLLSGGGAGSSLRPLHRSLGTWTGQSPDSLRSASVSMGVTARA